MPAHAGSPVRGEAYREIPPHDGEDVSGSDPCITTRRRTTERLTTEIIVAADVENLIAEMVDELAERDIGPRDTTALEGLAVPLANGIESWLRERVQAFVGSERFAELWTQLNRRAHDRVVGLMTGNAGQGVVDMTGDTVTLELAPLIAEVKQRLVAAGAGFAARIPEVDAQFVLVEGEQVTRAQRGFAVADRLGSWLSLLALGLIAAGIVVARDRRRALIRAGLGGALAMFALGLVLALARPAYLDALPADVDQAAAAAVFDRGVTFLRSTLRTGLVLGLIVAAAAFLAGPSRQATAARAAVRRAGARLGPERWESIPHITWLRTNRRGVQAVIAIAAALVLVFWDYPGAGVVVAVTIAAGALIAVVELVTTEPGPADTPSRR
ncbi:hypothetical protein G1H11_17185 [Phytoactinopolyspora alkaliphila]|uniref:Integral membrane protein n=1 Tax=Phytoactinopolyspora alkaliphila TaxID=1783498 RepID=A0A6N9YQ31_9ACTN|nr:hypothetical protein [Phytoactinopolyspora alkaliphila]NED97040.1 hypothetical protein [Phytoactinopolyspora alkaliphila]